MPVGAVGSWLQEGMGFGASLEREQSEPWVPRLQPRPREGDLQRRALSGR